MSLFFIAVGSLCGICGILAILLVIADRHLNDYGTCAITINGGDRKLDVKGGESLLSTLVGESIFIPSACGGRGSCGLCKLKVNAGAPPLLPTEEPHLSKDEVKDNVRLSCQIKVRQDMDIVIPEELFSIRQFKAVVASIRDMTYDIKRIRFELIDPETIDIVPGQYIQLEAPAYAQSPEPVYRAYSIATDPRDKRHIELLIRRVPNGICTTWVFDHLKEGQKVTLNGPYGDFRIQETDADMIFVAGGSGMAPFLSMLAHMHNEESKRRCTYFFGANARRDLFCLEEMAGYEKKLPNFRFVPCLARPDEGDNWDGDTGLVTQVMDKYITDFSDKEAYLCGSPGMIDASIKVLTAKGMPEAKVYYDKFA